MRFMKEWLGKVGILAGECSMIGLWEWIWNGSRRV